MDAVEYTRGSRPLLEPEAGNVQLFVRQGLKEGTDMPHCMALLRKYLAYNKAPQAIKIINRISMKAVDHTFDANVVAVQPLHADSDIFVVVTADHKVALIKVSELPDQGIATQTVEAYEIADASKVVVHQRAGTTHSAADPRAGKQLVVFTSKGNAVVIAKADQSAVGALIKLDGRPIGAASAAHGVIAFARKNKVSLHSIDKFSSEVLAKPWSPHGDDDVDFVHVFRRELPEGIAILTASGNELRLWTLVKDSTTLHQTAVINNGDSKSTGPFPKFVDADEDYVFLCDAASGRTVAFELSYGKNTPVAMERITEWALGDPVLSAQAIYRKVAAAAGAPPRHEMTIVARTTQGVQRFGLDQARLNGPGNVHAESGASNAAAASPASVNASPAAAVGASAGSSSGNTAASDLVKKFGLDKTPSAPTPASMAPTGFTHITSTTGGQTTTKSTIDPRMLHEAVAEQQRNFAAVLRGIDSAIVGLERAANDSLGALRTGQAAANAAGEASARQVAQMIFANVGSAAGSNGSDAPPTINEEVFKSFTAAITEAATITVQHALQAGLKHHVANAVDHVTTVIANNEKDTFQIPKLTATPSMQGLQEAIDKHHAQQNELFKRQKEQDSAKYRSLVRTVQEKSAKVTQSAAQFLNDLQREIADLRADLEGVGSLSGGVATAAPSAPAQQSEDQVLKQAMSQAEGGQWVDAFTRVVNFGNPATLMKFLQSDFVSVNREQVIEPVSKKVPLFVSVAQQLSSNLGENVGLIPSRTTWLQDFALHFDEMAEDARESNNKAVLDQINASQVHFANIVDAVKDAERHKGALDRQTKRSLTTICKALEPYGF